jgi:hypothetical protein
MRLIANMQRIGDARLDVAAVDILVAARRVFPREAVFS